MGAENSKIVLPSIDDDAVEVTDAYVLRKGRMLNGTSCSIFSGSVSPPLLTLAKNLKIYRHPNIIKYLLSSQQNSYLYLVTEDVQPLSLLSPTLSALQVCVGLSGIISALTFLHVKGEISHNNVCCASIFTSHDGVWKLGGLEFMRKFTEVSSESLLTLRSRRYEKGIPPEESAGRIVPSAIDVFSLGILIDELLDRFPNDELPCLEDLRTFTQQRILEKDPRARCTLVDIALHPFFSHDFIRIHRFLFELPLKNVEERLEFFRDLERQLKLLPESMVGVQLVPLLLARIVVIDSAAQKHLLPLLLRPRSEANDDSAFFSEDSFRKFVVPKLLQMFCVRDISVRLLLLTYLPGCVHCFTHDELRSQILPELLVAIKDIDDELVAATLRALAILVGVIGGSSVIGGQRARLFSDGRPSVRKPRHLPTSTLPERPSPDGGEDSVPEDTETWSDWEQSNDGASELIESSDHTKNHASPERNSPAIEERRCSESATEVKLPATLADIDSLDIKTSVGRGVGDEDFFKDMEPVITHTQIAEAKKEDKFKAKDMDDSNAAWDSFGDWADEPG